MPVEAVERYDGDTTTLASPTAPITATSSPPAGSTTSQCSTSGLLGDANATAASAAEPAALTSAPARTTTREGTIATVSAVSAGAPTTTRASTSRLVTETPQRGRVACAELGEDLLVEDAGDERDERQVERDSALDRGGSASG